MLMAAPAEALLVAGSCCQGALLSRGAARGGKGVPTPAASPALAGGGPAHACVAPPLPTTTPQVMAWVRGYQATLAEFGVEEGESAFPGGPASGTALLVGKYVSRTEATLASWLVNIVEVGALMGEAGWAGAGVGQQRRRLHQASRCSPADPVPCPALAPARCVPPCAGRLQARAQGGRAGPGVDPGRRGLLPPAERAGGGGGGRGPRRHAAARGPGALRSSVLGCGVRVG